MKQVLRQTRRSHSPAACDAERLLARLTTALMIMEANDQMSMFIFPTEAVAQLWDAIQIGIPPVERE